MSDRSFAARLGEAALGHARSEVYWLDDPARPAALPPLTSATAADLAIVGGGYTGLWTAFCAKQRDPDRRVVLLEAGRCGNEASGRNGGFASASLTHGFGNGMERWPEEMSQLDRLGAENLSAIGGVIQAAGIDCGWERTGEMSVATAEHQVSELKEYAADLRAAGHRVEVLDADATRARVDSPTYLAGIYEPDATAMVEPARLAWGLRQLCVDQGVEIFEGSPVTDLNNEGNQVILRTARGQVRATQVALATNAFRPLLRRLRLMTVPVYDHVLMTEPLSPEQLATIGWAGREGLADSSNLFHYYRITRDHRILWGGYDAVYHYGSRIARELETRGRTHRLLATQFFETFPQLEGLGFSHRWGGVIDTCTRFSAFFGTASGGRVAYALGYTGLGVAASRFGAEVVLDLLAGEETERTGLAMVRDKPLPFPPEPLRSVGINLTRWSLAKADSDGGRRNLWLRGLDKAGLGFDS